VDNSIFFQEGVLDSVPCSYNGTEFYGLLDYREMAEAFNQGEIGLGDIETETRETVLRCLSTAVAGIRHGQTVIVDGRSYVVNRVYPRHDGKTITLELVNE
jgi:hypothetical protein